MATSVPRVALGKRARKVRMAKRHKWNFGERPQSVICEVCIACGAWRYISLGKRSYPWKLNGHRQPWCPGKREIMAVVVGRSKRPDLVLDLGGEA